jgi:hypothetical protein
VDLSVLEGVVPGHQHSGGAHSPEVEGRIAAGHAGSFQFRLHFGEGAAVECDNVGLHCCLGDEQLEQCAGRDFRIRGSPDGGWRQKRDAAGRLFLHVPCRGGIRWRHLLRVGSKRAQNILFELIPVDVRQGLTGGRGGCPVEIVDKHDLADFSPGRRTYAAQQHDVGGADIC